MGLPWISTDQIRNIMRAVVSRRSFPKLFNPEKYDAERFLTEFSAEQIVQREFEQGEAAWVGIKDFIENDYTWTKGFVVEGINILPHLVTKDFKNYKNIKSVFLVDEDADRIREVVFTRGLWGDAKDYPDYVKEKEVEWSLLFSHKIKEEAQKYSYPVLKVEKDSNDLQSVLNVLGL